VSIVKVHRKGIIAIPKEIRERAGIKEGMLLLIEAREGELVLRPLDLWERVWGSGKGSAEEVERELDEDERAREERLSKWRK
jgi:AbrB family looped-hinge helix DNA binding protein